MQTVDEALNALIAKYRSLVADGSLSWDEAVKLFFFAVALTVRLIEHNRDMPGCDKKKKAMEALLAIYDSLIIGVTIPGIPEFLQPTVKSLLRDLLANVSSPLIDVLVSFWNRFGWGDGEDAVCAVESLQLRDFC